MSSSGHIHTFWQQGEVCCCLHTHPETTRHFVAVCSRRQPFLMETVADPEEAAAVAERFWTLFADAHSQPD